MEPIGGGVKRSYEEGIEIVNLPCDILTIIFQNSQWESLLSTLLVNKQWSANSIKVLIQIEQNFFSNYMNIASQSIDFGDSLKETGQYKNALLHYQDALDILQKKWKDQFFNIGEKEDRLQKITLKIEETTKQIEL